MNRMQRGTTLRREVKKWQGHRCEVKRWQGHRCEVKKWQGHRCEVKKWQGHRCEVKKWQGHRCARARRACAGRAVLPGQLRQRTSATTTIAEIYARVTACLFGGGCTRASRGDLAGAGTVLERASASASASAAGPGDAGHRGAAGRCVSDSPRCCQSCDLRTVTRLHRYRPAS